MERQPRSRPHVTSRDNSRIKWLRSLKERRYRCATGAFLVEGPHAIAQALASGAAPRLLVYDPDREDAAGELEALQAALPPGTAVLTADAAVLATVGETVTTQGLVAAFPILKPSLAVPDAASAPVLVLDRIRDPGNLGTLLRSAAAAGAHAVLLSEGCADPYGPKVVRASAGALFTVPFALLGWAQMANLLTGVERRYAAAADGAVPYHAAELARGCAILVGNEADGLGGQALSLASRSVRIPIEPGVESLNAAVAGSVLLFEARRQRVTSVSGASS